jgi:hypothetical protein
VVAAPAPAPVGEPVALAERPHGPEAEEQVTPPPPAAAAAPQEAPALLPAVPLVPSAIAPPGLDPLPGSVAQVAGVPVPRPVIAIRPGLLAPPG